MHDLEQISYTTAEELQTLRTFPMPVMENDRMVPTGALAGRVYGEGMLLPTITASYRSSVNLCAGVSAPERFASLDGT